VDGSGELQMASGEVTLGEGERKELASLAKARDTALATVTVGGAERVVEGFWFEPFGWYLIVSEERSSFYGPVNEIAKRTAVILVIAIAAGVALVLVFARYLTGPIARVGSTMREIISTNDLSKRVVVEYHDEIGQLAQTFNIMTEKLEQAYREIKGFAFQAEIAKRQEKRTRTLFSKFVPENVIHEQFANPEETLVGDNRVLAILFSDIRSFTTISESMKPDELVFSLNRYFEKMVSAIMERNGVVDKYIGDAIKAFYGSRVDPSRQENFALQCVLSGLEMSERLVSFNQEQTAAGRPEFKNGVGIHYGVVTIGNLGTDKKKEYTVIGDVVDLAEHFESLTKGYKQPLIFSESVHKKVKDDLPCRLLDSVPVDADPGAMRIYTARSSLSAAEKEGWSAHNMGMAEYFDRSFARASEYFREALNSMPGDTVAALLLERSERFEKDPPPEAWDGTDGSGHA
jgi:adenylate cyclase